MSVPDVLKDINVPAFVTPLIVGGQVGMLLVLLTILCSRQIMRHAIFINFCITWILYSLSYLLLFYAGQMMNQRPGFSLCLSQAAMADAAPTVASTSSFMFILHIYLVLRRGIFQLPQPRHPNILLATMLAAPYIVYWTIFTIVVIVGIRNPHTVSRATYYCHVDVPWVFEIVPAVSTVAVLGVIIAEALIAFTMYRHWRIFRKIGEETGFTLHFMIRAFVFTLFAFLGLIACGIFVAPTTSSLAATTKTSIVMFIIASLPLAAFLVFGTQLDLLRAWLPREKKSTDELHSYKVERGSSESLLTV